MATPWIWPVAKVIDVIDGDTLRLDVDQGFSTHAHVAVRLADVRAPELDEPDGPSARNDVLDWLREHAPDSQVQVTTQKVDRPLEIRFRQSFTRYIGVVVAPNGAELNSYLRDKGFVDRGA
jgi:endonuclease YncB( thermonuclease family)